VSRVVLDTDVASRSFKRLLPPQLLAELIGREPSITRDFAEHEGLVLITG
jgi:hypothetical protein